MNINKQKVKEIGVGILTVTGLVAGICGVAWISYELGKGASPDVKETNRLFERYIEIVSEAIDNAKTP